MAPPEPNAYTHAVSARPAHAHAARSSAGRPRSGSARPDSIPGASVVLDRHFNVIAASDEYLAAARTTRDQVVGRSVFQLSPDPSAPTDHTRQGQSQAQRLQTVGMLAGGVAHEVSNMMTAILGFAELVLQELGPEHPQHEDVAEIVKAAVRTSHVTRQLLAFSRQQTAGPAVADAVAVVEELVPSLRQLVGADRRLMVRSAAASLTVSADRGRLEQVIINLVANARDATATDGLIAVETDVLELDEMTLLNYEASEVPSGWFARVVVRDNGVGMTADVLDHAFEPFFTTKAVGVGTGLGLPMVNSIVRQSGGFLRVESVPGKGTAMAVYLPLVDDEVEAVDAVPTARAGSGEKVLVVEDEPVVRTLACRILAEKGYQVIDAPNGAAALDSLTACGDDVALVVTDVVMPRMTGPELAAQLRGRCPDVPVLFMSGYGDDDVMQRGLTQDAAPFVQKPFTTEGLAEAVAELLERRGGVRT